MNDHSSSLKKDTLLLLICQGLGAVTVVGHREGDFDIGTYLFSIGSFNVKEANN
jgi:hypothetical protein